MAQPSDLGGWIAVLLATQMLMLIYGKKVTSSASLPLMLCLAQFTTSATLSGGASLLMGRGLPWMPRDLWRTLIPLSIVWTAGFVLFNASAAVMSPSLVSLVRCMEPLATVGLGLVMGERYTWSVLATLVPICGGVALASFKGGLPSPAGIGLAMLSNVCFCGRPFFKQQLKRHPSNNLDALGEFFNITCVSVVLLPPLLLLGEGAAIPEALRQLGEARSLARFSGHVLLSSLFFFLYQFTQLKVMAQLTPLAFSVLTPVVKAFMIVACSFYFGDEFGVQHAVGVAISCGGGYLFSLAKKQSDADKAKSKGGK